MCDQNVREEQLLRIRDRSLTRHRISFREQLVRNRAEWLRKNRSDHRPENCSDCRDEEDAWSLIRDLERDTRQHGGSKEYEIKREFVWTHYDSGCAPDSCPHGSFSLHGVKIFEPCRLKGVAKIIYEVLSGPEYDFQVEIIESSTCHRDSFRLRITW